MPPVMVADMLPSFAKQEEVLVTVNLGTSSVGLPIITDAFFVVPVASFTVTV